MKAPQKCKIFHTSHKHWPSLTELLLYGQNIDKGLKYSHYFGNLLHQLHKLMGARFTHGLICTLVGKAQNVTLTRNKQLSHALLSITVKPSDEFSFPFYKKKSSHCTLE